ncbi:hypothetical protein Q9R19_13975 [Microbacterium sp. ARD32]|uniref:hypothetical protein n=1 Tax=Microbacterium sp. ARD32 TaxID=2962577 RepID=UPI002880C214|nr:hypothetical protein [Microbacterium sp. ARD32]MDT0158733.1 hypothetical protein [Microbacterium sp. ARD32]
MFGGAVILCGAVIAAAMFLVWRLARRPQPVVLSARILPVITAARRRAVVAVAFSLLVFLAGAVAAVTLPSLLGAPLAIAPLVAATAGLLFYAATPPGTAALGADELRSAGLTRRSWITAIPARWLRACVELVVLFAAVVVFCGVTAAADDQGRSRAIRFEQPDQASMASPYPGWFYGIPALIALVVLLGALVLALHRIGSTAAFPHPDDVDADRTWRRASAAVVLQLASGAILLSLGGIALVAGLTMRNALVEDAAAVWGVTADILTIFGTLLLVLSVVSVTLAVLTACTIGEKLERIPEPVR